MRKLSHYFRIGTLKTREENIRTYTLITVKQQNTDIILIYIFKQLCIEYNATEISIEIVVKRMYR